MTIARHFNAGLTAKPLQVPQGRPKFSKCTDGRRPNPRRPFSHPVGTRADADDDPALKRRAIVGLPRWDEGERAQATKSVMEKDDSCIPEEFKEVMKDAEAGQMVDMETALYEAPPPRLQCHIATVRWNGSGRVSSVCPPPRKNPRTGHRTFSRKTHSIRGCGRIKSCDCPRTMGERLMLL